MTRALLFASVFSIFSTSAFAQENAKIGSLFHLTGEFSIQGEAFRQGVELALDDLNSAEGAPPIQGVFEDTQYRPVVTSTAAKKLLLDPAVRAVLVSTLSEAKSIAPEFQRKKIPLMVLWDSSPELEKFGDYVFGIGPWVPSSGEYAATFSRERFQAKTAVVVNSVTEWSLSVSEYFVKSFTAQGGKVLETFSLQPGEMDFRTPLLRAKSLRPDVLYVPVDANIPTFFRQAKDLGIAAPLLTSDLITEDNLEVEKESFEGVYQTMTQSPELPETKRLLAQFRRKYGTDCKQTPFIAWAYDAAMLIGRAIQSGRSVRDEIAATRGYRGASGEVTFSERGSAPRAVEVRQIRGGKFEIP